MKCFIVILLTAVTLAVSVDVSDNAFGGEKPVKTTSASSLQGLFQTLIRLVEGVLDGDKFVLNTLRITEPLNLTDNQIRDLNRLLDSLKRINIALDAQN